MMRTAVVLALFGLGCVRSASTADFDRFLAAHFERADRAVGEGRFRDALSHTLESPELSLFLERRSIYGFQTYKDYIELIERLEAEEQRKNVNAIGKRDAYRVRRANLAKFASGDLAYATFDVIEDRSSSPKSVEEALAAGEFERVTMIFRRIDGTWKVAHVHASYQAPPGPHWSVPKNTSAAALWDPQLQADWRRKVCADPSDKDKAP
jgi:hypothetical protein